MGGNICTSLFVNFQLVNLKQKNNYVQSVRQKKLDLQKIQQLFKTIFGNNNNHLEKRYQNLLSQIWIDGDKLFEDPNFSVNGWHASKLYNYQRKQMCLFDQKNRIGHQTFSQNQVQFTYLSVIGYFLSQNKQLLANRILVTKKLNKNQIYCVRLFSNGQDQYVIIDDKIPTNPKDQILYSQPKGKQIWPFIIEKAWCKLIGGYKKALGLSPLQCLQEITGIPSKAFNIQKAQIDTIAEQLHGMQKQNRWLIVIAKKGVKSIQQGQVFAINQIQGDDIYLTSPFHQNLNNEPRTIKLSFQLFLQSFSHLIVGYYKKGYEPFSYRVRSQKGSQKLYEINIKKSEQISIRFVQYYKQYLQNSQQNQSSNNYQYSPLAIFELYDHNGNFMKFCQGCQNQHVGVHSVYLNHNICHSLEAGKYYLRIQVDWMNQQVLSQGNLVVYSSFDNVQIKQLSYHDQQNKMHDLQISSLNLPNAVIIYRQNQLFKVNYLKKKFNILFSIENLTDQKLLLQLNFEGSYNFKIKQIQVQKDKKVILKLGAKSIRIFQIMPDELRPASNIQMCAIRRLPNNIQR